MMCDKMHALDDMIMCHSCGDMSLCLHCFCHSHNGHDKQPLRNRVENLVKQLQQWKDEMLPVLESLTLFPSTEINRYNALLNQHQIRQLEIGQKRRDFECMLRNLIDSCENELNAGNGYKFDFASLENQFNQSITKHQELADAVSRMLMSGDVSAVDQIGAADAGILLTDGQFFEFYFPTTNTTKLIDIEMQKRCGFVMGVLSDGRVMVVGGRNYSNNQPAPTFIIDLVSKQVTQGPPMTTGRRYAASAMIGGEMYVCGGEDDKGIILSSCEVYRDGQWIPIADMKEPHGAHAVVAMDGLLYAIGGGNLNSVECYSPVTNSWQPVSSLNEPRLHFAAAAFNGYIYAAGGLYGVQSCERYCPDQDQWEKVAPMNKGRHGFSLLPFGDKLYALGGSLELPVESYDAVKNEWKIEDVTLNDFRKAVVVDYLPN